MTVGFTSAEDLVLEQAIPLGPDNSVLHLDPDRTYLSWVAGIAHGISEEFLLYLSSHVSGGQLFLTPIFNLNFFFPKGSTLYCSSEAVSINHLIFSKPNGIIT